jgi:uncharacterized membrane protein YccC
MDFIRTKKTYKLIYVLFWVYFCIGMPAIERFNPDFITGFLYVAIGAALAIGFSFWDLMKTNKER